ncbi:Transcription regulator HTH, LysR [Acididesulfobacillus acetoxydans]|uniref:LysR substrate binding domain protein n=1 Tax=Acididesulfobacillus acetoxydans TaxID=1561005 RepID=A0A8S0XZX9_9FIRM|nr:LysR family transcriptional regulator [Acididesulfobacillus acetoxydans]CAA7602647.1 Transcription regulator HTH, LysR [Acididesulfobacillus acetoxydans]CEJ09120.1 LysR substrate binding domain protein [Acididesulfobacillus acetoxydans]
MEIRQLRYFDSVVKYSTIRGAAEHLFISEPTISQQLQGLQKEIGIPLFERQGRKITLTSEGKQILPLVQQILASIKDLEDNIAEIKNPAVGFIRLGIIPVSRLAMVPDTLKEFGNIYPGIGIEIIENGTLELIDKLLDDTLDIALVAANNRIKLTLESAGITYKILTSGNSIVIASQDNPLARQDKISLSHLRNERIILNRQGILGEEVRALLGDSLKSNNIYSTDTQESALKLVESGVGISILPEAYITAWTLRENSNIKILELDDSQINLDLCCIYKQKLYRPQYLQKLIDMFIKNNGCE